MRDTTKVTAFCIFLAFTGTASADDGRHRPSDVIGGVVYPGPAYQPFPYYAPPEARTYTGRSAFWADGCAQRPVVIWRHGRKIVRERLVCD